MSLSFWKNKAFQLYPLDNRFPPLHGLRVLAIISVIQIHISHELVLLRVMPEQTSVFKSLSFNFWFGMDLFFILSGFLIGHILLSSLEKVSSWKYFGVFYLRRAFRTFPLYYFVLTGLFILFGEQHHNETIWKEYCYLSNYPATLNNIMYWAWSLSVEEHFYFVAPIVILILKLLKKNSHRLIILLLLWISGLFVKLYVYKSNPGMNFSQFLVLIHTPTHVRYDIFFAGIFLAYVQKYYSEKMKKWMELSWLNKLFVFIPIIIFSFILFPFKPGDDLFWKALSTGTLTGIGYMCLIIWILNYESKVSRFFSSKFFFHSAILVYAVFLTHIPMLRYIAYPLFKQYYFSGDISIELFWTILFVLVTILSIILAYVIHMIIEKPFLILRDRLMAI